MKIVYANLVLMVASTAASSIWKGKRKYLINSWHYVMLQLCWTQVQHKKGDVA